MKKISSLSLLIIGLFVGFSALAQNSNLSLTGKIIDAATKEPLIGATVIIDSTTIGSITDATGTFIISPLTQGKKYKLNVSYFGYADLQFTKTMGAKSIVLVNDIAMQTDNLQVEEVVITGTAPIAVQLGDTTQFNAGAYKTNPDATAGDLIAKMPGFEIVDGVLQTGGEEVKTIYVDGKAFFSDDPMGALSALPASIVESIQLLDEASDEAKFTGIDDGEKIKTINIVTTAKGEPMRLGDFTAGYGTNNRYTGRANVNIFGENQRLTVVLGANNINQGATGGGSNRFYGRHWKSGLTDTQGGKINYSGDFKRDSTRRTKIGVNYVFNRSANDAMGSSRQLSTISNNIYNTSNNSYNVTTKHSVHLNLESWFGDTDKITFRPRFNYNQQKGEWNNTESLLQNGIKSDSDRRHTDKTSNSLTVGGHFHWNHRFSEKHSMSLGSGFSINESGYDQAMNGSDSTFLAGLSDLTDSVTVMSVAQNTDNSSKNNWVNGSANYVYRLTDKQNLSANYTISYNWTESKKLTSTLDSLGNMTLNETLSNAFNRDYITHKGGLSWGYNDWDKIRISVNGAYQTATINNQMSTPVNHSMANPMIDNFENSFQSFIGNFWLEIPFTRTKRFSIFFRSRPNLPSVGQLQDVIDDSNSLKVRRGNSKLVESTNNHINVRYINNNIKKSTSLKMYVWGNNYQNNISNKIEIMDKDTVLRTENGKEVELEKGAQLTTPVNAGNKWNLYSGIEYSFPLNFIKSKMNTSLRHGYSNSPALYNNDVTYTVNNTGSLYLGVSSNISENVDFTIGNRLHFSHTVSKSNITHFLTNATTVDLNLIFLKHFVFNTNYTYNYSMYSTDDDVENTHLLNAGIGYKFYHNKCELRVSGFDLLNQNVGYWQSTSDQYITNSENMRLTRYVLLTFSYKFNSIQDRSRKMTKQLKELMNLQEVE